MALLSQRSSEANHLLFRRGAPKWVEHDADTSCPNHVQTRVSSAYNAFVHCGHFSQWSMFLNDLTKGACELPALDHNWVMRPSPQCPTQAWNSHQPVYIKTRVFLLVSSIRSRTPWGQNGALLCSCLEEYLRVFPVYLWRNDFMCVSFIP